MKTGYLTVTHVDNDDDYEKTAQDINARDGMIRVGAEIGKGKYALLSLKELIFPTLTTIERDSLVNPRRGSVIYNESTGTVQVRTLAGWEDLN